MYQPKFFKGAILCLCFLSFTIFTQAQDCQHQALIDKMDQGMADKDINLMDEIYHADAVRHTPDGDQKGLEKIKASAAEFYKNVPDAQGKMSTSSAPMTISYPAGWEAALPRE